MFQDLDRLPNENFPSEFTELSDDVLIEMVKERGDYDNRPFQELFRRYNSVIWRVCYNFVHNSGDAEDIVQEVFFKAYRNLGSFEGRSSFKTWLYRIAINTSQNELRRRSRRLQVAQTPVEDFEEFLKGSDTPEKEIVRRTAESRLRLALERIRPEQYEAIHLKDLEERPYQEVADMMGVSLSAAKMRVQRARLALRQIIQEIEAQEVST